MNDEGEGDYAEQPDLDDDVPEAGSYQHTDTEVEDSSSLDEPLGARAGDRRTTFDMTQEAVERSMRLGTGEGGSGVLGSSVFGSSPVLQMSYQGRRASGGGRGRGRGREN